MNKKLKLIVVLAIIFAAMVGLIPANIAWAGQLWQTLPTRDLSATPILIRTTAAPHNTLTVTTLTSSQTKTSTPNPKFSLTPTFTLAPGVTASTTPSPTATSAANANPSATEGVPVNPESTTPAATLALTQETAVAQDPGTVGATMPPGFVPTESTQTVDQYVPVVSNDQPSQNKPNKGSSLPVPLILVGSAVLIIIIGVVLGRLIGGKRHQE